MAVIPTQTIGWTGGDAVVPTPAAFMVIGIFELAEVIDKGHVTRVCGRSFPVFIGRLPGTTEDRIYPVVPGRVPLVLGDRPLTSVLAQDRTTTVEIRSPLEVAAREAVEVAMRVQAEVEARAATSTEERDETDSGGFTRPDPTCDPCCDE